MLKIRSLALSGLLALTLSSTANAAPDWTAVGQAVGKAGTVMPGGVYRVGLPRTDLHVMLDGIELKPTFALGSWVAFTPMGDQAMVMGDLVLTEDEIEPVMKSLLDSGLEITAAAQSSVSCPARDVLYACRRHGRSRDLGALASQGAGAEQDAVSRRRAAARHAAGHRPGHGGD